MEYSGPTDLYIDGTWTSSDDNATLETIDPATEDVYATVAQAGAVDVDAAVTAAVKAADRESEWRSIAPSDRGEALRAFADALEARKEEITLVESHDNGKTPFEADIEVTYAIDTIRYYAGWTDKIRGETIPVPNSNTDYTLREPLGATAHIAPWNYPFQLAGRSLAPALACGNSVVLKPSSTTPLSALYYGVAAEEAGLPDGVVNVLPGSGSVAGDAFASHPDIKHVAFTGSTAVGKEVLRSAADTVSGVTLELGGKGPNIVFPDADFEAAAKGCQYGIFMNAGQMCWAGSRLLVHESIHDEFVDRIVDRAAAIELGSGIDDDGRMGPLIADWHRDDVQAYVDTARKAGATVVTGGTSPADKSRGFFFEPTVLTDVTPDMPIAHEEVFGPVLVVLPFSDRTEAIEIANDSPYGLSAGVWTTDLNTAHTVVDQLDYGMVSVNEYPVTHPQTPFGGYKQSGSGREQGAQAIDEYTQIKNVNLNIS